MVPEGYGVERVAVYRGALCKVSLQFLLQLMVRDLVTHVLVVL